MNLLIYDKLDFTFKEALNLSSDYRIILDLVINQSSYFVTNHTAALAKVGDIVILHERSFFYIGTITGIELTDIGQVKIIAVDYLTSLDFTIQIMPFSGNIGAELIRYLNEVLLINSDVYQNRPFLKLVNESNVEGKISNEEDKLTKFSDFYTQIYKEHKVRLQLRLGIVKGTITHLKVIAIHASNETILSSNFPMIRNLAISDNKATNINKITFIPSVKNTLYTTQESFYLLADGTISTDKNSSLRILDVVEKKSIYKDDDLKGSVYKHQFASGQIKLSAGSISLSGISWYQTSATYVGFSSTNDRGVQIGSLSNPQTNAFYLQTSIASFGSSIKITEVKITLATASILNRYKINVENVTTDYQDMHSLDNAVYTTGRINQTNGNIRISLMAITGAMYISKIEITYQPVDSDAKTLLDMASDKLLKEDYMHNISFSIAKDNSVFIPLSNIYLGDKVLFIHKDKSWQTILSRIEMTGTTKDFLITLGEERIKLTEKLKIILEGN